MESKLNILKQEWAELHQNPEHQKIRIKDAADMLNVSEAELLSTTIGENSYFLNIQNWEEFFNKISLLGSMMYLVRNDYAVHENNIHINHICIDSNNIVLSNSCSRITIDQTLIEYTFYTSTIIRGDEIYSIHLFDKNGIAIIKIYLKNDNLNDFKAIKNKYKINYNFELQLFKKTNPNIQKLKKQNTKKILMKPISDNNFSIQKHLEALAEKKQKIQIKVSNKAATSVYKGTIKNVIHKFGWLNIMDPTFNLHLQDKKINKIFRGENHKNTIFFYHNEQYILNILNL